MPRFWDDNTLYDHIKVSTVNGQPVAVEGTVDTLTGLEIPAHDKIELSYTGDNLTTVVYKSGLNTVATLTLTYTGSRLDSVTKS